MKKEIESEDEYFRELCMLVNVFFSYLVSPYPEKSFYGKSLRKKRRIGDCDIFGFHINFPYENLHDLF